jgi:hypothetical protein
MKANLNRAWAILFARLVLGLIFFMAGVMKVFQLGPLEHARKYFLPFSDTFLPTWSLWAVGVTTPFIELIGGALVLLGLRTAMRSSRSAWYSSSSHSAIFCTTRSSTLAATSFRASRSSSLFSLFRVKMTASRSITS